jgi:hypothetical protein
MSWALSIDCYRGDSLCEAADFAFLPLLLGAGFFACGAGVLPTVFTSVFTA